jgi:FixJ family two-component response regulator/GGDEF domain-containing protein
MSKGRVLAVDDQRYFRELIDGLLTEEGYEVKTASSGEAALNLLGREDFDVVVTDLVMPGIDGTQLVERIKECVADQDIVIVTGVVDVKTAVEAMKQGATDYILKPIDHKVLSSSLEKILQSRRLQGEHSQLMAENIEIMGVLSLYERAAALFSTLSLEPLVARLVEGLCLETKAQGGVMWVVEELSDRRMALHAARGIVRVADEPQHLEVESLEPDFAELLTNGQSVVRPLAQGGKQGEALYVPLCHQGSLIGLVRLSDKLDAESFGDRDRAASEKFVGFGTSAVVNALRFRSLGRRSFRDPATKAYTDSYFRDAVRNEIHRAARYGYRFSLLQLELDGLEELRQSRSETEFGQWLEALLAHVGRALRSTDVLATEGENRYRILLTSTDGLGTAVLKQRIHEALEDADLICRRHTNALPALQLSSVTFPTDGTQIDGLLEVLEERIGSARNSVLSEHSLHEQPFAELLEVLLSLGENQGDDVPPQIARFLLEDLARRPKDAGVLFIEPGRQLLPHLLDGIDRIAEMDANTEIVMIADPVASVDSKAAVTWVPPAPGALDRSFLLYYGDGPAFAMVTADRPGGGPAAVFHSSDRVLVEHLVFQLHRDLYIPVST